MMIVKRSASGRRVMSLSRSTSTGLEVFCTGSRYWPAPSCPLGICFSGGGSGVPAARGCVGRQLTNFSPSSASGSIVQLASARKLWKPGFSIFSTTAACACGVGVTEPTEPTFTPSIFTFSPEITLPASSKIARTV